MQSSRRDVADARLGRGASVVGDPPVALSARKRALVHGALAPMSGAALGRPYVASIQTTRRRSDCRGPTRALCVAPLDVGERVPLGHVAGAALIEVAVVLVPVDRDVADPPEAVDHGAAPAGGVGAGVCVAELHPVAYGPLPVLVVARHKRRSIAEIQGRATLTC